MIKRQINSNNFTEDIVLLMSNTDNFNINDFCMQNVSEMAIGIDSVETLSTSGTSLSESGILPKYINKSWSEWWDKIDPSNNDGIGGYSQHDKYLVLQLLEPSESCKDIRKIFMSYFKYYITDIEGVFETYIKFNSLDENEYFNQEADLYFLVTSKLFLDIDILYDKLRNIRRHFESEKKIMVNYNYTIYSKDTIDEYVPREAQEL